METSIIAVEENPVSKSSGSLIQINSIYIDLQIPKETDEIQCFEHNFTIRGYASEMRMKNPKASLPFPSDGNLNDSVEQLPPLQVKRSRWWCCPECRGLISTTSATEENEVISNCCTHRLISSSTSLCIPSHDDTAMVLPETHQGPTPERSEGIRDVDMNHSPNMVVVQDSLPLPNYQEAKNVETGDLAAIDGESKLADPVSDVAGDSRDEEAVVQLGDIIATGNKEGRHEQEILGELNISGDCNSGQACEPERANSPGRISVAPLKGCLITSSRSDKSQQHENSIGLSRRKVRKVRFLTDILGDVGKMPQEEGSTGLALVSGKVCLGKGDSEKTVTGAGVPVSVAETNSSSGISLQIGRKTDRKRKAEKILAPAKRKAKQLQVHGEVSPIQPLEEFSSNNSLKDGVFCPKSFEAATNSLSHDQTERGKSNTDIPPTMSHISKSLPSSHDRSSNLGLDLSLSSLLNPTDASVKKGNSTDNLMNKNAIHSGQFNVLRPSEPDQSWRKRQIWDLNARAAPSSSSVLEEGQFPLPKEVNFLQLHHKSTYEVQGSSSGMNTDVGKSVGKGLYGGSSDDIPMEIVELMAKNQFERSFGDAVRRFPEVNGLGTVKQLPKSFPVMSRCSPLNAANGNSVNFSHVDRNLLKMAKVHENQLNIFNAFPSNKLIIPGAKDFSATASVRSRGLPFGLGIPQNSVSLLESEHKGKTVSDIKADELKKAQEAHRLWPKPATYQLDCSSKGQFDPYANESIPAMQLLSLMDWRSPRNSLNMGGSKTVNGSFAHCGYHPRFRTDGRRDLLNRSLFLRQNRAKELSGLGTGQSSGPPSFALSRQPSFRLPEEGKQREISQRSTTGGQSSNLGASTAAAPQLDERDDSRIVLNLESQIITEVVRPLSIVAPNEACSINRNPAEFSIPEAGNIFTISGTDLKFLKRKYSRVTSYSINVNAPKRQRVAKTKARKEHPQNHSA